MSSLIRYETQFDLTKLDLNQIEKRICDHLRGRVLAAYVFGSFATGNVSNSSDIDLILVTNTDVEFIERPKLFLDLFDIYPNIDLLVYTPREFADQLTETVGFWKSVKQSMRQLQLNI